MDLHMKRWLKSHVCDCWKVSKWLVHTQAHAARVTNQNAIESFPLFAQSLVSEESEIVYPPCRLFDRSFVERSFNAFDRYRSVLISSSIFCTMYMRVAPRSFRVDFLCNLLAFVHFLFCSHDTIGSKKLENEVTVEPLNA